MREAFIGVDLGGTKLRAACGNTEGEIMFSSIVPTKPYLESIDLQKRIIEIIENCFSSTDPDKYNIRSIGIGIPGVYYKNHIFLCDNIKNLEISGIGSYFKEKYNIPVFVLNDVKCAALGESWQGAGKNIDNLVYLNIGTGISIGIILGGKLYSGRNNASGEIAYLITDVKDARGFNDGYAPLESIFSGKAINDRVKDIMKVKESPLLMSKVKGDIQKIDTKTVFWGYRQGDELCRQVVEEGCKYIAMALANISIILNPDVLVFGGGVSTDFDIIRNLIGDYIHHMVPFPPDMMKSGLDNEAGLIGAIRLAMLGLDDKDWINKTILVEGFHINHYDQEETANEFI